MLQFLSVIEEESPVVGPKGEPGNCTAATPKGTAKVIPPGLAKVKAVCQRGTCDGSVSRVNGVQGERLVVVRFGLELLMEIGY